MKVKNKESGSLPNHHSLPAILKAMGDSKQGYNRQALMNTGVHI